MKVIEKVRLHNFKRFREIEVPLDPQINILVGDNESGKSSILLALDLAMGGNENRVRNLGIQSLLNTDAVSDFFDGDRKLDRLPKLIVELFLNEQGNPDLNGKTYGDGSGPACDGLRLVCEPRADLQREIADILQQGDTNFPFEFYSVKFQTFADQAYTGYRKYLRHLLLDSAQIGHEYAMQAYIRAIYGANVDDPGRFRNQNEYRRHKARFEEEVLKDVNEKLRGHRFSIKTNAKANLETDLTITEDSIPIENKGRGRQCFIKAQSALQRGTSSQDLDVLLMEEPENHLSHVNMKRLIHRIDETKTKQLFIATHSNLISTRLDLRKAIMLSGTQPVRTLLAELPEPTAKFFMKAPDNNILEFILSKRVILVEGDAEYILLEAFYESTVGAPMESADIHVISVGGTSFKRFLDLAKLLGVKTAIVRDNDKDVQGNCIKNYADYTSDHIQVFYDESPERHTFEVSLYACNEKTCDEVFAGDRRTLSVLEYMLKNKADAAFELLDKKASDLVVPPYIESAIEWIRA